ncbi:MAG: STT3 domain-containing protein [Methanobacterium sp.]
MLLKTILNKKNAKILIFILIIFFIGFVIRVESINLSGIPDNEKTFYQDQNGIPYMYEPDSYYNYRLTENYIDHGYLGDVKVNGHDWDLHSLYPPGRLAEYPPLIVYLAALFYYILNIFANIPPIVSCFWLPAFIGPLSGVLAFLIVRRFSNDYGAVAAGIFVVTAPFYFIRTVPGWFDTDMFIVFFPLLIMWFIAEGVYTDNYKKRITLSVLAALSALLFSYAWEGWAYVFYIIVFSFLVYIILGILLKTKIKNIFQVFSIFTSLTIIFIYISDSSNIATILFPLNFIQGSITSSWPDILLSVSELGVPSVEEVISELGFIFFAGILSLLWIPRVLMNQKLKEKYLNRMTWFLYLIIIIWTIIGILSLTKGARFIMILIPPVTVSSGIMVGICIGYLDILKENKKIKILRNENFIKLISIGIILLVLFPGIINALNTSSLLDPFGDDNFWTASEWLGDNTSNDTVIISEWSYGYLLSAASKHPVSVDGGTQNTPRTYWIYRAFSTDNENLSTGIFRMISSSGDTAPLLLDNYTKNTTETVEILNNILPLSRNEALYLLESKYHLNIDESIIILNYTHPLNPKPYVILTSNNMLKKGYWTIYYGLWDFNTHQGHEITYTFGKYNITNNVLNSSNGILMNLKTGNTTWNGKSPYMVILKKNNQIKKNVIDKRSNFSIFILEDSNSTILIDKGYENTLFMKMLIENNSTNFKDIYKNKDVIIWKSNN